MTAAYYNENDRRAAAWLRELIKARLIAVGDVDERSIADVKGTELAGYTQCHFFAGIGGWSLALRLAGWPDERRVWTGSCPCQPFSSAGKGLGEKDPRHLWPEFCRLIRECHPATVFGEQVASAAGRIWLAGVRADLEALVYAVGAADLCAAGAALANPALGRFAREAVHKIRHSGEHFEYFRSPTEIERAVADVTALIIGPPHIRQRLYWVADTESQHNQRGAARTTGRIKSANRCATGWLGKPDIDGRDERQSAAKADGHWCAVGSDGRAGAWDAFDILPYADGKARRVESGTFPLAHGIPGRVGLLRGYGNAIVPQVAAEFVMAFLECGT